LNLPKLGLQQPLLWPISALPYSKVAAGSKFHCGVKLILKINFDLIKSQALILYKS
jgi:hypothetical protein